MRDYQRQAVGERQVLYMFKALYYAKGENNLKRIFKSITSAFMIIIIFALSIVTTFAANDPVQGKSYSYSETGNCTVAYGGQIAYSASYLITRKFTVNGNAATCAWASNQTPEAKTYKNVTKYYINNTALRAKAFYWLIVSPNSTIPTANAKYNSSSTTFQQDLATATNAAHSGSTQTYAFAHCVIDYLQQGQVNPYGGDTWNNVVKAFAAKVTNYPNAPSAYKIFYFYPNGNARQSLMSYDSPGYIQITKRSAHPGWTQSNSNYNLVCAVFTVYSDQACTKSVTTITCNSSIDLDETVTISATGQTVTKIAARGKSGAVAPGTYYLKETTAPPGYVLNPDVFSITVTAGATATRVTNLTSGAVTQSVSDDIDLGDAQLVKVSSNPEVTDNNSDFSLAGAVYGIFYDAACTRRYKTITTGDNGTATATNLVPSTYYVKEITAPKGFEIDTEIHPMTVRANQTAILRLSDEPSFVPPPPEGYIHLIKHSASPKITQNKGTYSLEGAVYGIYSDVACTDLVQEMVTDSTGECYSAALPVGNYYVKEITASEGYQLDLTVYPRTVTDGGTDYFNVNEVPYSQTFDILLQKVAAQNGATVQHTDVSGAEYTVNYYAEYLYTEEEVNNATPFRTWVLSTDANGQIALNNPHLVSGGAFFRNSNGENVVPLGTITIQETAAPLGYFIDETVYIRQITKDSAACIVQYNTPLSIDYEIENIEISGTKIWDDDSNRDGKRSQSVTIELYRDNELYDSTTVSESDGWTYSFTDLPKAYADFSLPEYVHYYFYEVHEVAVENYDTVSDGMAEDENDENHLICDFVNHYTPEKINVSGTKTWDDYDDLMGCRPSSITVILYRDNAEYKTKSVSAADNWQYEFTDLYKYHDGGQEYVYTIGERAVTGYEVTVNGYDLNNTMKTGKLTIYKTDTNDAPMRGVKFRVYSRDIENDGIVSTLSGGVYHFKSFTYSGSGYRVYTTNAQGKIVIDNLPYGNYKIVEETTNNGYMLYGEPILVTLNPEQPAITATAEVENAKAVMPETGGVVSQIFYTVSIILTGIAALLACAYIKKSNMKG